MASRDIPQDLQEAMDAGIFFQQTLEMGFTMILHQVRNTPWWFNNKVENNLQQFPTTRGLRIHRTAPENKMEIFVIVQLDYGGLLIKDDTRQKMISNYQH